MSKEYRFVIFGGQGSPSVYSPSAATTAERNVQSSSSCSILLSRCHAAFLQDIESLDAQSQHVLSIDTAHFSSPDDLLRPSEHYHTHAVIQATTIYLCQVLHFLGETQRGDASFEDSFDRLHETAGFSSGLLPATIVARSSTLDEFVASGIEDFRLAFWIAYRSHLACLGAGTTPPGDIHEKPEATSSLVIRGLSLSQVESRLAQHAEKLRDHDVPTAARERLQISAVSSTTVVSMSGPVRDLELFRAEALLDVTTKFAYVHGWYHGGDQLGNAVDRVIEDLQRRGVSFPKCAMPAKPVRPTLDGHPLDVSSIESSVFLRHLVEHLLLYRVDWSCAVQEIKATASHISEQDPIAAVKMLCFGPATGSLLMDFHPLSSRTELRDLSPFQAIQTPMLSRGYEDSIAIVGMSVNLPRGKGRKELWDTLSRGLDAVSEIPASRFNASEYYADENSDKPRSMPCKYGAFLDDPFTFDNTFFNISPREAKSMDPQQRLLLHAAQESLEDAGHVADSTPSSQRDSTGCYIGLATGDYAANLRDDIDVFYAPGNLRAFHSGRISYFYKLSGPSTVTDTACSSSMVSIYQACRALQSGDCTTAIAGGVNVISSPDMYLGLARGHFLSPTGACKPFDAGADGYCRAEGCVLFVLKMLSDAVADNDRIHGVIRNVMVNQSGNAHSITHPHSETQADLLRRLLHKSKVDAATVGVVEAHGTGTKAGDTREIDSLRIVFGPHHSAANPVAIGSIKGNVGHCEAASGAAGLAKLLLMLRERSLPPQVGLKNINPHFADLENPTSGFTIARRLSPWEVLSPMIPRRAVLNNFGAAGSNASLLLEEWAEPVNLHGKARQRSAYVFLLSAKSEAALHMSVQEHVKSLRTAERRLSLRDICYTATARRQVFEYRISMACSSVDDLLSNLEAYRAASCVPARAVSTIVFVFSGQGGSSAGMGEALLQAFPAFRETVVECDNTLKSLGHPSILEYFSAEDVDNARASNRTEETVVSQCACVTLEYALAKMIISWGIVPEYVMGYSLGEYAALCISGVMSLEDTLRLVAGRARLMADHCEADTSTMLVCSLSAETARSLLSEDPTASELDVACITGPNDCVIGGPVYGIESFRDLCKARGVKTKRLNVPYAFHTAAMDPILEHLHKLGQLVELSPPKVPVFSNVFGRLLQETDLSSEYFSLHARQPVRLTEMLRDLKTRESLDGALFLEMGPQPTTLPMIRGSLRSDSCSLLGTLHKNQDACVALTSALAEIALLTIPVRWRECFSGTSAKVVDLPGHPLRGSSYVVPYKEPCGTVVHATENSPVELRTRTGFDLLPWSRPRGHLKGNFVLETPLSILGPLISGHDVGGTPICPASLFHELALEGAQTVLRVEEGCDLVVTDVAFANPLVYTPSQESGDVVVDIAQHDFDSGADFRITSRLGVKKAADTLHCAGIISQHTVRDRSSKWARDAAIVARQTRHFSGAGKDLTSTFRTKVFYETIFSRVVRYAPEYQTLRWLSVADGSLEGIGEFILPAGAQRGGYVANPVFTDTLLHAAGFLANLVVQSGEVAICVRVDSVEIAYRQIDIAASFTIYCSLLDMKGVLLADAVALDNSGQVVAVIRGMEFKRLRLSAFRDMLARTTTSVMAAQNVPADVEGSPEDSNMAIDPSINTPPDSQVTSLYEDRLGASLRNIVMEVSGFSEEGLDPTKPLEELGIDSLMRIEIVSKLARMLPGHETIDHHELSSCETLEALEKALSIQPSSSVLGALKVVQSGPSSDASMSMSENPVALHTSNGGEAPLFLFHDGSGQVSMYGRLHGHDRSTNAFFDSHFGVAEQHQSLQKMAKEYVSLIPASKLSYPLIVGGWSFGGILAFEAARQLIANGVQVKGLILIDSPSPADHEALPDEVIAYVTKSSAQTGGLNHGTALREEFRRMASLLASYQPGRLRHPGFKTVILRSRDVLDTQSLCGVRYDWLSDQQTRDAAVVAWKEWVAGPVATLTIPGNHFEAFSQLNVS
ncbi:hypothetical protein GGR56DRAFT_149086 [Xylariaceae sp. FL0804]|nr:hypothetical protein GGR56DRAFT_149086 [Xylariaceae sp. FL0804]